MKKFLLASASLLALGAVAPACAADVGTLPSKAPPAPAQASDWTGFYGGFNAGGGSSHTCLGIVSNLGVALPASVVEGCHNATGALAGGQAGYRWQSVNVVFGFEAQGDWADFTGRSPSLFFAAPTENRTKIDALGLFTGQAGYAYNNVLWYFKGGAAVTHDKYQGLLAGIVNDNAGETRWGGVVGTGFEVGFAPNWTVGAEYDHAFMGHRTLNFVSVGGATSRSDTINQDVDMATVRVNYRFSGPVVAKF
jgi:outer membrane immunogenic protein